MLCCIALVQPLTYGTPNSFGGREKQLEARAKEGLTSAETKAKDVVEKAKDAAEKALGQK